MTAAVAAVAAVAARSAASTRIARVAFSHAVLTGGAAVRLTLALLAAIAETGIMGGAENVVTLITADGAEEWPRASKAEVARRLANRIADVLDTEGVA